MIILLIIKVTVVVEECSIKLLQRCLKNQSYNKWEGIFLKKYIGFRENVELSLTNQ